MFWPSIKRAPPPPPSPEAFNCHRDVSRCLTEVAPVLQTSPHLIHSPTSSSLRLHTETSSCTTAPTGWTRQPLPSSPNRITSHPHSPMKREREHLSLQTLQPLPPQPWGWQVPPPSTPAQAHTSYTPWIKMF